ncbi:MAG: hypothetical protein AAFZ15_10625 [Bacteroidota bacterium]
MSTNSFLDRERRSVDQIKRFQLPHSFKRIGLIVSVLALIVLFASSALFESAFYKEMIKYVLLFGMLIIVLAKEQIEDERIAQLRLQAFRFAFVFGVIMTLMQPFAHLFVDLFAPDGEPVFAEKSNFKVLWYLLAMQIFYFEYLKKLYR